VFFIAKSWIIRQIISALGVPLSPLCRNVTHLVVYKRHVDRSGVPSTALLSTARDPGRWRSYTRLSTALAYFP